MKNYKKKFKEDFMGCLPFEERLECLKEKLNIESEAKRIYLKPHPFKRVTFTMLLMLVCIVSTFFITRFFFKKIEEPYNPYEQLIENANKLFKDEHNTNTTRPFITIDIDNLLIINMYSINQRSNTDEKIYYYQICYTKKIILEDITVSFQINDDERLLSINELTYLERLNYYDSPEESEVLEIYVYIDNQLVRGTIALLP